MFYTSIADYYDYIFPLKPQQVELSLSLLNNPPESRLLDFGCATGRFASAMAEKAVAVTAFDPDEKMICGAGCKNELDPVQFYVGDLQSLPPQLPSFDLITCFGNTLAHLNADELLVDLKNCHSRLAPNGKMLIQILNYEYILKERVIDLPLIDNETVRFERSYSYETLPDSISFITRLLLKKKMTVIDNQISLYPHTRNDMQEALVSAGFSDTKFYGDLKLSPETGSQLPLVIIASK